MVVKDQEGRKENLDLGKDTSRAPGAEGSGTPLLISSLPTIVIADRNGNRLLGQLPLVRPPFHDYRARYLILQQKMDYRPRDPQAGEGRGPPVCRRPGAS